MHGEIVKLEKQLFLIY